MLGFGCLGEFSLAEWQSGEVTPPTPSRGAGWAEGRPRYIKLERRKTWRREIEELIAAEVAVVKRAEKLKNEQAKEALEAVAEAARKTIEAAEAAAGPRMETAALARVLAAAAKAKTTARILRECAEAMILAQALIAAFDEDEEESIMLLLQ